MNEEYFLIRKDEILELCNAAVEIRDSINDLWRAQNPDEDVITDRPLLTIGEAQLRQSDAFSRLKKAEYYVRKMVPND